MQQQYIMLEAAAKSRLTRKLIEEGWDVRQNYLLKQEKKQMTMEIDLLATRGDEILAVEFSRENDSIARKRKILRLREMATSKGWQFRLETVKSPEQELERLLHEAEIVNTHYDNVWHTLKKSESDTVKNALLLSHTIIANQLIAITLEKIAFFKMIASTGAVQIARKLVDQGILTNEVFRKITDVVNTRNRLLHTTQGGPTLVDSEKIHSAVTDLLEISEKIASQTNT